MPKIKYDLRDVESSGGFDTPPPGLYRAKLAECNQKKSKQGNDMLECVYELSRGDYKGSRVWDYVVLNEASEWKLKQFLEAVGKIAGKKSEKGAFDPDEFEDSEVQVRLKHETYNDEPRARVAAVLPLPDADEDEDEEDLDEETDAEASGDEDGDEEGYTYAELAEMDLDELKEVIEEEELEGIRVTKKSKAETVLAKVAEALEVEEEEEESEDEDEDGDEDEDEVAYEDMETAELKQECKDRGLKAAGKRAVLIARLEKDDEEAEDPFE